MRITRPTVDRRDRCLVFPSRPRAAGPSTIPSSAPSRCRTRTRSRPSSTSSSARRSSSARGSTSVASSSFRARAATSPRSSRSPTRRSSSCDGIDGEVRAFHNICRHRGNKLVWNDIPREETSGTAGSSPASTTAGGTTSTAPHLRAAGGRVLRPRQGRLRPRAGALRRVGGVHLRQPRHGTRAVAARLPRADGHRARGLPVRPDDRALLLPLRGRRRTGSSSWTRSRSSTTHRFCTRSSRRRRTRRPQREAGFEAPHYRIDGPHRLVSTVGRHAPGRWPTRCASRSRTSASSGLFGPWDEPDLGDDARRASTRPKCDPWGLDSFQLFPNFVILIWGQGWYLTYHYWPTSYNTHIFEGTLYFVPPKNAARAHRAGDGGGDVQGVRAAGRQHARGDADRCSSRGPSTAFPLNDQEILLRHLHKETAEWVDDYQRKTAEGDDEPMTAMLPTEFADLEPFARLVPADRARALRQAAGQLDGRDAGVLRRDHPARRGGDRLLRQVPARRPARGRAQPAASAVLADHGVVPGRVLAPAAACPTPAPPTSTASSSRSRDATR